MLAVTIVTRLPLSLLEFHLFLCLLFRVNVKCPPLLEDELLVSIGRKYNKSSAQVALRFNAQRGVVVIPKSFNPERIKHNFQVRFSSGPLWVIFGNHIYTI